VCSYNAINGVPTCCDADLNSLLRDTWGFDGYITSDSGAIADIYGAHHFQKMSAEQAAAAAILSGVDVNSGSVYSRELGAALKDGTLNMSGASVGGALGRCFRTRMRLGLFDGAADQPYEHFGPETVGSAANHQLSLEASRQALTLLQNNGSALPLLKPQRQRRAPPTPRKVAVIGPNADGNGAKALMAGGTGGCAHGTNLDPRVVCKCSQNSTDWCCVQSPFEAIRDAVATLGYGPPPVTAAGCSLDKPWDPESDDAKAALVAAAGADDIVLLLGGHWETDHEGMDRKSITLPGGQVQLFAAVAAVARSSANIVAVLVHGGQMDLGPLLGVARGVLDSFYPGMHGAQAIAEALFGQINPGGKVPATIYREGITGRTDMDSFEMAKPPGRGYRFLDPADPDVIFGFGHGLSYTTFALAAGPGAQPASMDNGGDRAAASVNFSAKVTNTGAVPGDETVLAFWRPLGDLATNPVNATYMPLRRQLFGFQRVAALAPGASAVVSIALELDEITLFDADGNRVSRPGSYEVVLSRGPAFAAEDVVLPFAISGAAGPVVLEALPPALVARAHNPRSV
jgi:xylan 1,4-beta-xylosidase